MSFTYCSRKAGVNFTNILSAGFWYESQTSSSSVPKIRFNFSGRKKIGAKAERKMLVKLTTGWHQAQIVAPFFCWSVGVKQT